MPAQKNRNQGFTLVEILIVVVILGILAAIVIPQFTSASESARASSLTSQLQTMRSQLELYQVQHNGDYPDTPTDGADGASPTWPDMTEEENGFGPYLQQFPTNPFASGSNAWADHWAYDKTHGLVKAVVSPDDAESAGLIDSGATAIADDNPDFATAGGEKDLTNSGS